MSNFKHAMLTVLQHEGGLVNDSADPGGITNYGISLRYLRGLAQQNPDLLTLYDVNHDGQIDATDIRSMTQQEATDIYKTQWWDKNNYGLITDQALATKIFDLAVNVGNATANKFLQKAVNQVNGHSVLLIDGIIGPQTIALINKLDPVALLTSVRAFAIAFYQMLAAKNPAFNKLLKSWINRVEAP